MRLFLSGASARAARASDPIFATASSGADLGWAASTACDDMSGAGADVAVRVFIASGCHGAGRPERWLTTIGGAPGSNVAFARYSNATSTKPTTARKARAGITAFRLHAYLSHRVKTKRGYRDWSSWTKDQSA